RFEPATLLMSASTASCAAMAWASQSRYALGHAVPDDDWEICDCAWVSSVALTFRCRLASSLRKNCPLIRSVNMSAICDGFSTVSFLPVVGSFRLLSFFVTLISLAKDDPETLKPFPVTAG